MINLLVPVTQKRKYEEIVDVVKNSKFKQEIIVRILCEKNNPILQSKFKKSILCTVDTFPVGTTEDSMISATVKELFEDDLIIVRENCKIFSTGAIDTLLEKKSTADIVMFSPQKKKNKFKAWCERTFEKMCKSFFNFNFFKGDTGIVYFSPMAHSILQEANVTKLTKINHWLCLKVEYIPEKFENTKTCEKVPKQIVLNLIMYPLAIVAVIVGTIFLLKLGILQLAIIGFCICFVLAFAILTLYAVLKFVCFKKFGLLYCKNVAVVERRNCGK